jgi:hypothetical protein
MLENYAMDENFVVHQVERTPFTYDTNYAEAYDKLGDLNMFMSYLRMGWVKGTVSGAGTVINSIMDVGYGNGSFLRICTDTIRACYGSDISGYPVPDGVTFVEDWLSQKVDVATFFDVIEHFPDPYILKDCCAKYIVGSVPWCHDLGDEWFSKWKHRKPNEHLWFFHHYNIHSFASAIGYKVTHTDNPEDVIRGNKEEKYPNIMTFTMRKL